MNTYHIPKILFVNIIFVAMSATMAADGPSVSTRLILSVGSGVTVRADYAKLGIGDYTYEPFVPLLKSVVGECDQLLAIAPKSGDTSVQRNALSDAQKTLIEQKLSPLPNKKIKVSFEIEDVARRGGSRDDNSRAADEARFPNAKYAIYATLPPLGAVELSADDRDGIQSAQRVYQARVAEIGELARNSEIYRKQRTELLQSARKKLDNTVAAIRRAAENRLPKHEVVVLTGDDKVLTWKRGQRRSIEGAIYFVEAKYDDKLATATVIQMLAEDTEPDDTDAKPTASTDKGRAAAAMSLARGYYQAKKKPLALQKFKEIVEQYPGTDEAAEAQKFIDFEASQKK